MCHYRNAVASFCLLFYYKCSIMTIEVFYMGENERKVIEAIKKIVDSGSNAEVKRRKDGTLVVYEVKKNIVAS